MHGCMVQVVHGHVATPLDPHRATAVLEHGRGAGGEEVK